MLSFHFLFGCLCICTPVLHHSTSAAGGTKTEQRGNRPSPSLALTRPASVTTASSQWVLSSVYLHWHYHLRDCWSFSLFFPVSDSSDPKEDPEPDQTSGVMPHTSVLRGCSHGFAALLPPPSCLQLKPCPLPGTAPHAGALAPGSWTYCSVTLPGSVFSLLTSSITKSRYGGDVLWTAVDQTGIVEQVKSVSELTCICHRSKTSLIAAPLLHSSGR